MRKSYLVRSLSAVGLPVGAAPPPLRPFLHGARAAAAAAYPSLELVSLSLPSSFCARFFLRKNPPRKREGEILFPFFLYF